MENRISASTFRDILNYYKVLSNIDPVEYYTLSSVLTVPIVPIKILDFIFKQVTRIVAGENLLLNIHDDVIVVGDLHGHLLDLLRILKTNGFPPVKTYLFLGDIVDKGEFSTETLTLIALLKLLYPKNIFIIRGNHEFEEVTEHSGFLYELRELYDNDWNIENQIIQFFNNLPLAAIINDVNICVHGGLGPNFTKLSDLSVIRRPIVETELTIVQDIVWSDPSECLSGFHESTRGCGCLFGEDIFKKFMADNKMEILIRGHECVQEGIRYSFEGKLITVFSASNYCNSIPNKSGILSISKKFGSRIVRTYERIHYITRSKALFITSQCDTSFVVKQMPIRCPKISRSVDSIPDLLSLDVESEKSPRRPVSPPRIKEPEAKRRNKTKPRDKQLSFSMTCHSIASPRRSPRPISKRIRYSYA